MVRYENIRSAHKLGAALGRVLAPISTIHPVPENVKIVELAARYSDMENVLEVPRMGLVTAAFKDYSRFLRELCCGLQPPCSRQAFVDAVGEVRDCVWKTC